MNPKNFDFVTKVWDSVWFFIKEFHCSSVSKASPAGILHKTVYAFLIGTLIGIVHLKLHEGFLCMAQDKSDCWNVRTLKLCLP
jgi:hypothetical protein